MEENKKLLEYFNGDELACSVWESKYKMEGEVTPDDMHRRMAKEFIRVDLKHQAKEKSKKNLSEYGKIRSRFNEDSIYELFKDFKWIIPQGSIMAMLGNKSKIGCLSNCFVIGQPQDSYGGILKKDEELVQLMKRRGGVGVDISTLRPAQTSVTNSAGTSTGAVSFMERFSNSTREVAQNGRRGALMLTIDVRHPDVFDFVNIKKDRTKVTGANISVLLRDDFMKAVKNNEDYILRFPCSLSDTAINHAVTMDSVIQELEYNKLYTLRNDFSHGKTSVKKIKAKELYDSIVENAWDNAEPGQMFVDRHWNYSPDGVYSKYKFIGTNPCGEIGMSAYDACRLIAINLFSFVENPFTKNAKVNYQKLYEVAYEQQRLADNIVDLEIEHINRIIRKVKSDPESDSVKNTELGLWEKVKDMSKSGRRTGCGVTALGDMLAALGLPYDSDKALKVIDKIFKTKMEGELDCSIDLAILRGPFKGWNPELEKNEFYSMIEKEFPEQHNRMNKYGRRNVSFSTVAPTGSVSILTQTSSGLEPLFQPFYMRRVKVNPGEDVRVDFVDQNGDSWTEHAVLHPKFKEWMISTGNDEKSEEWTENYLKGCFKESPWYGSTANDIDWEKRVDIQAIIQKYTSHSISSTINLPNNVSKEAVADIYLKAHEKGLKGVTVYRDGCRTGVLVTEPATKRDEFSYVNAVKRPKSLPVDVYTTVSKGTKWNVFVGLMDEKPYEVFAVPHFTNEDNLELVKVKKGRYDLYKGDEVYSEDVTSGMNDEQEVITRLASTCLRHGADIRFVFEQLDKSHGDITSFSKAIGRTLKRYIPDGTIKCDNCGEGMVLEEGCMTCKSCGNSKCG